MQARKWCVIPGACAALAILFSGMWQPLYAAHAQAAQDTLSPAQVDQVRELGNRPADRIKLYLKFVDDRLAAIQALTPDSKENDRPTELRSRYEEFTRLTDELSDNIDTYDGDHADIRKALHAVVQDSAKWAAVLKAPAPDATYDFARTVALDAEESTVEQANKLLASEQAYFSTHKKEAGKNGKAPSPDQ